MPNVEIQMNAEIVDLDSRNRYPDLLMADHLRGLHPYGRMRRDCPLCVQIDKTLGS